MNRDLEWNPQPTGEISFGGPQANEDRKWSMWPVWSNDQYHQLPQWNFRMMCLQTQFSNLRLSCLLHFCTPYNLNFLWIQNNDYIYRTSILTVGQRNLLCWESVRKTFLKQTVLLFIPCSGWFHSRRNWLSVGYCRGLSRSFGNSPLVEWFDRVLWEDFLGFILRKKNQL